MDFAAASAARIMGWEAKFRRFYQIQSHDVT
jgi:hypothetical protein